MKSQLLANEVLGGLGEGENHRGFGASFWSLWLDGVMWLWVKTWGLWVFPQKMNRMVYQESQPTSAPSFDPQPCGPTLRPWFRCEAKKLGSGMFSPTSPLGWWFDRFINITAHLSIRIAQRIQKSMRWGVPKGYIPKNWPTKRDHEIK